MPPRSLESKSRETRTYLPEPAALPGPRPTSEATWCERFTRLIGTTLCNQLDPEGLPVAFTFIKADKIRDNSTRTSFLSGIGRKSLPRYQEIPPSWHETKKVSELQSCLHLLVGSALVVSHRWETIDEPDPTGVQLASIVQILQSSPQISLVWYDFWSLPQGKRSDHEEAEFKRQLPSINRLYLGASVLILLDISYKSRFWCAYESWLSMQQASADGLEPVARAKRYTITPIHSAANVDVTALEQTWLSLHRTPVQAQEFMAAPGMLVTNESDKQLLVSRVLKMDDQVKQAFADANLRKSALERWMRLAGLCCSCLIAASRSKCATCELGQMAQKIQELHLGSEVRAFCQGFDLRKVVEMKLKSQREVFVLCNSFNLLLNVVETLVLDPWRHQESSLLWSSVICAWHFLVAYSLHWMMLGSKLEAIQWLAIVLTMIYVLRSLTEAHATILLVVPAAFNLLKAFFGILMIFACWQLRKGSSDDVTLLQSLGGGWGGVSRGKAMY